MKPCNENQSSCIGVRHATKRKIFKRFLKVFLLLAFLALDFRMGRTCILPDIDRHGEYFFLTKKYRHTAIHFTMWGKRLMNQDSGKFQLFPSPTVLFPGIPLMLFENLIVCPLIDILLIPTDMWRNFIARNPAYIKDNGLYVQVMDVFGRPVSNIEVRVQHSNYNRLPIICNGHRQKYLRVRGLTDENGELFVPVDMKTVNYTTPGVSVRGECMQGKLSACYYWRGHHPPFDSKDDFYQLLADEDIENPDTNFPVRDTGHSIRMVLEPELVWPDKRNAQWSFVPEKKAKIWRPTNWEQEEQQEYYNLTDME